MPSRPGKASDLIAFVVRHVVCQCCHTAFGPDDVQVAVHEDAQWALLAVCPACQATQSITAYDSPPYQRLGRRDVVVREPITPADVNAWSSFLSDFQGDLFDLLSDGDWR